VVKNESVDSGIFGIRGESPFFSRNGSIKLMINYFKKQKRA